MYPYVFDRASGSNLGAFGKKGDGGCYALLTSDSRLVHGRGRDHASGDQLREYDANANTKVFRISSVNLPVMDPLPLNGQFGGTNQLSGTVNVAYDDPTSPFVHTFAPMHDNQQTRNGVTTKLPEGEESWTLVRDFNLRFASEDPDDPANPAWGASEAGGEFRETLDGLFRPIHLQGKQ